MSDAVYVLIDHGNGSIRNASLETLAFGQQIAEAIGSSLRLVVLGSETETLVEGLRGFEVEAVQYFNDPLLAQYQPEAYTAALAQILEEEQPRLLLMAHTYQNIDLAPKLAARLKKALITDCIGFRQQDGELVFTRQMFRNKLNADLKVGSSPPWIVTMQAGAYSRDDLKSGSAPVLAGSVDLSNVEVLRESLQTVEAARGQVDLTQAEIIVAAGRGIKKEENVTLVKELAEALGAEIGASRPVVDSEWLGRERQIGSSGQNVSPRLYVALGISGAIQHIVGMKGSQCVVAINNDPNAPIFNVANYGIVGDLFEVVPALTRKLKES